MLNEELKYWLGIIRFPKIGATRLRRLYNFFPSMKEAFYASSIELKMAGLEEKVAEEFTIVRKTIDPDKEFELMQNAKLKVVTFIEPQYPKF